MTVAPIAAAALLAFASVSAAALAESAAPPLPPEQVFALDVQRTPTGDALHLGFNIRPGYYLYRDRISAKADSASVSLAPPQWPDGEVKHDPNFGEVRIFREQAVATLPLPTAGGEWTLRVRYQGCADAGLCYPPQTQTFRVSADGVHPEQGGLAGALGVRSAAAAPLMTSALLAEDESARVARKLAEDSLALTLLGFFAAGLLLALTPCMLPMVPILSGIIVGQGVSAPGAGARGRAFRLSLAYVLGMAVTYALVGVAAGVSGVLLSGVLQNPWVLSGFALLFVVLALSMFGLFDLQLPAGVQGWATHLSNRIPGGQLGGSAGMGVLSALIVGPCIAPPLAGALLFISKSGDVFLGGSALFVLALGMGLPLLVVGTSAGHLLSRAAAWYDRIRVVFGVVLLGLAVWIVSPIWLPAWDRLSGAESSAPQFRRIGSLAELQQELQSARGQPVLLDFTADWCTTCRELERDTFADATVASELSTWRVLRADVTAAGEADRQLLASFGLFGPPAVLMFGADGQERKAERILNFVPPEAFLNHLKSVKANP
jgi:thiol:disulfide interchange protein DsbD